MRTIIARNVNEAYEVGLTMIKSYGVIQASRNGDVLVFDTPVVTDYEFPRERVLFDRGRKANPFFHFMECLWMLAGSDDGRWLDTYVHDFSARFGETDGRIHGAYGHRWAIGNQITRIVHHLDANPDSRQAVLQMWDQDKDLDTIVKDKPCNTHIYFRVQNGQLDMTVCCRSNDMIWGAYGANAVHMSVLQEVIATALSLEVGSYYQFSNNLHVYTEHLEKYRSIPYDAYFINLVKPYPLFEPGINNFHNFMGDVRYWFSGEGVPGSPFFSKVVQPMKIAHGLWKQKNKLAATEMAQTIAASDWRLACLNWLGERT